MSRKRGRRVHLVGGARPLSAPKAEGQADRPRLRDRPRKGANRAGGITHDWFLLGGRRQVVATGWAPSERHCGKACVVRSLRPSARSRWQGRGMWFEFGRRELGLWQGELPARGWTVARWAEAGPKLSVRAGGSGRFRFARQICGSLVGPEAEGARQAVPDAAELRRRRAWEYRNGERSLDEPGANRMLRVWQRYENFCTRGIA